MDFELVFKELLQKFHEQNIRFALIGGFAMQVAGFARATVDIDFLVEAEDLNKVKEIMKKLSYELTYGSEEFSNYWHPISAFGCVDYLHAHRPYSRKMLRRAKNHKILGTLETPILQPEDIIGLKVQAISNNSQRQTLDMGDIEYLIKKDIDTLDLGLIKEYFDLFGKGEELNSLLKRLKNAQ